MHKINKSSKRMCVMSCCRLVNISRVWPTVPVAVWIVTASGASRAALVAHRVVKLKLLALACLCRNDVITILFDCLYNILRLRFVTTWVLPGCFKYHGENKVSSQDPDRMQRTKVCFLSVINLLTFRTSNFAVRFVLLCQY